MKTYFSVNRYKASRLVSRREYSLSKSVSAEEVAVTQLSKTEKDGALATHVVFTAKKAQKQVGISVIFEADCHELSDYIFAPAALYNGNRFYSVERAYAPMYTEEDLAACAKGPVITDVPRLALDGTGKAQLNTGDLTTPCAGFYSERCKQGFLLFWRQQNEAGNFGLTVSEDLKAGMLRFAVSAPCVREETKYAMCTTKAPSDDRGVDLHPGNTLTFDFEEFQFPCNSKTEFLNTFFKYRTRQSLPYTLPHDVPWSYAFDLLEAKYNTNNWVADGEFYKSSEATGDSISRQWQTGWVGGAMNTLPGLCLGNSESVEKSRKTLDFVFDKVQHPSGFLYGVYCDGRPYGDCFTDEHKANITMSRKNADAMYFIAKQLLCLRKRGEAVPEKWSAGLRKLADAFIAFYDENHDLAQFVDMDTMEPFAPGTASAAIAPAGLALCSQFFAKQKYLDYACEIAQKYYDEYVREGFTNGGPGEILACPDSESAFGMLESLMALYSCTGDEKWVAQAVDTASLCASWCVSYDYAYEKDTQWAQRGIATTGAVWASVQNKHAAPGICTLSGASLFRLFRATGDIRYLELCREISHNITQFISTPENPMYCSYVWTEKNVHLQKALTRAYVKGLKAVHDSGKFGARMTDKIYNIVYNYPGRMGERCNLSDWEGKANVGELPGGSCWCEVSTMLTYFELPAVYINPDTGFVFAMDHVHATCENGSVTLENPTNHDAVYRVFAESKEQRRDPLPETFMLDFQSVYVPAHQRVTIKI